VEIDHVTIPVRDYAASKRFYERSLAPLGFRVLLDWPDRRRAYLGLEARPSSLWLVESTSAGTLDLSLAAPSRDAVAAFHATALAAGGRTSRGPGVRAEHSPDWYAARVLDPDGNAVEAVHRGERASGALAA
jgi:catechol 2,3-dioxygenase-like lactoylglutathione lyase family enzyme